MIGAQQRQPLVAIGLKVERLARAQPALQRFAQPLAGQRLARLRQLTLGLDGRMVSIRQRLFAMRNALGGLDSDC